MRKRIVVALLLAISIPGAVEGGLTVESLITHAMPGEPVDVGIFSDSWDTPYTAYIEFDGLEYVEFIEPLMIDEAAGPNAWADDMTSDGWPGWWYIGAQSYNPEIPIETGRHFTFKFKGVCWAQSVRITLYDSDGVTPLGYKTVTIDIPEPGSVALLGLGCLMLRRGY